VVACKICGRNVPSEEMAEHVRIELMDPKYFVQRQAERERNKNPNNDHDIYIQLKGFADRRTDIFGDTELVIGQSVKDDPNQAKQKDRDRVIWDGHSTSISEVLASKMQQQIPIPEPPKKGIAPSLPPQMLKTTSQTTSVKSTSKPVLSYPSFVQGMGNIAPPPSYYAGVSLEPPSKKMKAERPLLSAEEFLAQTRERSVKVRLGVPNEPNKKWKLNGQVLSLEISLTHTILQLKEKLEPLLGGMKPENQHLVTSSDCIVLKDHLTFADYNLSGVVSLQLKVIQG